MSVALSTAGQVVTAASQLGGLAVLAGALSALVALGYRRLTRERVALELAVLAGLAGVVVYLSTTTALARIVEGESETVEVALFNAGAFVLGGVGAYTGYRLGDTFGRTVLAEKHRERADGEFSQLVRAAGQVTVVDLPEEVGDVVGYDPVTERTREAIAGERFVFPRTLSADELEKRLRSRLKTDFGVGAVDLELSPAGTVERLAVGSRAAGIGPTLPPATNAVALRADPAFSASTGDVVQVWETDPARRVLTGELRGVAGDVVTVAINSTDTPKVDPTETYRLVTLPVADRPAREFASLLRAADRSYASVTVEAGSPLHGMAVGALRPTVVGVEPDGDEPVALPTRTDVLSPGETVLVIGLPAQLRKLERAAKPIDPSITAGTTAEGGRGIEETTQTASEDAETASRPRSSTVSGPGKDDEPTADDGTTDPAKAEPDVTEEDDETPLATRADPASFDQLKSEYDGEDWDDEPVESSVGGSEKREADSSENTGDPSFEELKSEFESGEADWGEGGDDADVDGTGDGSDSPAGEDDLVEFEEAEFSFEEETADDGFEHVEDGFDDQLEDGFDEDPDDGGLSSLGGEEDDPFEGDDLFADETPDDDSTPDEESGDSVDGSDEESDDSVDGSDEESDEGGASTFAQLKEEFESGEADWEDEISDSPGGDMRLEE